MSWSESDLTTLFRFVRDGATPEQIANSLGKPVGVVTRKLNNINNNPDSFAFEIREEEEEESVALIDSVRAAKLGWNPADYTLTTLEACVLEVLRRQHEHMLSAEQVLSGVTRICLEREWFDVKLGKHVSTTLFLLVQLDLVDFAERKYQIRENALKMHQSAIPSRRPSNNREVRVYAAPSFKI